MLAQNIFQRDIHILVKLFYNIQLEVISTRCFVWDLSNIRILRLKPSRCFVTYICTHTYTFHTNTIFWQSPCEWRYFTFLSNFVFWVFDFENEFPVPTLIEIVCIRYDFSQFSRSNHSLCLWFQCYTIKILFQIIAFKADWVSMLFMLLPP